MGVMFPLLAECRLLFTAFCAAVVTALSYCCIYSDCERSHEILHLSFCSSFLNEQLLCMCIFNV